MRLEWIPNSMSLGNLFMGFFAIVAIGERRFEEAVWMIALALILDSMDGNIARIFNAESEVGKELDSLADLVSFVVAPSLLVLKSWPCPPQMHLWIPASFFLGAGAYRLARFNVTTVSSVKGFFLGLPTPAAAMILIMTTVGLEKRGVAATPGNTMLFFAWIFLLSFTMVSSLRYPKITVVRFKQWKWLFVFGLTSFILAMKFLNAELAVATPFIFFLSFGFFSGLFQPRTEVEPSSLIHGA